MHLIVMRLKDMTRVHPHQITGRCSQCGQEVGIYPSGQRMLQEMPGLKIACQVCKPPATLSILAPGAEFEPFESRKK